MCWQCRHCRSRRGSQRKTLQFLNPPAGCIAQQGMLCMRRRQPRPLLAQSYTCLQHSSSKQCQTLLRPPSRTSQLHNQCIQIVLRWRRICLSRTRCTSSCRGLCCAFLRRSQHRMTALDLDYIAQEGTLSKRTARSGLCTGQRGNLCTLLLWSLYSRVCIFPMRTRRSGLRGSRGSSGIPQGTIGRSKYSRGTNRIQDAQDPTMQKTAKLLLEVLAHGHCSLLCSVSVCGEQPLVPVGPFSQASSSSLCQCPTFESVGVCC